jgi:(p)ppGpp synthase/HD superfamily hydrolase
VSTLERAIAIAAEAHAGHPDKGGAPYVLHPLRVMLAVGTMDERIVAVLHDVVEDSKEWSFDRLRQEGFSEEIVGAVDALTKREGEEYMDRVRRAKRNPIARAVKLADLHDNMDVTRLPNPTPKDFERRRKYERAEAELLAP